MLFNFLTSGGEQGNSCNNNQMFIPMLIIVAVVLVVVLFVMPMINGKRQKKNVEDQRASLSVGDTIETVGGIIGVIKEIRELAPGRKELVLESGTTTLVVDIQALYMVISRVNPPMIPMTADTTEEPFVEAVDAEGTAEEVSVAEPESETKEADAATPEATASEDIAVSEEAATVVPAQPEETAVPEAASESVSEDKPEPKKISGRKPAAKKSGSGKNK